MGKGGEQGSEPASMGWIRIDHYTAHPTVSFERPDPQTGIKGTEVFTVSNKIPGDPDLHSHTIVPNYLVTESGRFVAINKDLLRGRRLELGTLYQARLTKCLHELGVETALDQKTGTMYLPSIPKEVCEEFSKRTKDADGLARKEAAERGLDWDQMSKQMRIDFLKGGAKASRRSKADDLANVEAWKKQAEELGWKHETIISGPQEAPADPVRAAYTAAMPFLDDRFQKNATLLASEARVHTLKGFIAAKGIEDAGNVDAVVQMMAEQGIRQDGKKTRLYARPDQNGTMKLTTAAHLDREEEIIRLIRATSQDFSRALTPEEMAAERSIKFTLTDEQRDVFVKLGSGGAFSAFIGVGGAGKTDAVIAALAAAYKARGYGVYRTAQAWDQANKLADASVPSANCRALDSPKGVERGNTLIASIKTGKIKLGRNDVVFVDELSQIGSRQLLDLLLLQNKYGFLLIGTGDDRQGSSIEAGHIINLIRNARADNLPELLTSMRQKTERERKICRLFRENKVAEAIAMKWDDQTCLAADGSYEDVIDKIAQLAIEKRAGVTVPINADVLAVGGAIRRKQGIADEITIDACDQHGKTYPLPLGTGDTVRLFAITRAQYKNVTARFGVNGTRAEVIGIHANGLTLKNKSTEKTAFIPWDNLRDPKTGKIRLTYGTASTIDSAQGATYDYSIAAMPRGSSAVEGFRSYVAQTRHRIECILVTSKAEEMVETRGRRPLGVKPDVSEDEIWQNVCRNLSRLTAKENGIDLVEQALKLRNRVLGNFQTHCRDREAAQHKGAPLSMLRTNAAVKKAGAELNPTPAPTQIRSTITPTYRHLPAL
jgi:hypothetical protein